MIVSGALLLGAARGRPQPVPSPPPCTLGCDLTCIAKSAAIRAPPLAAERRELATLSEGVLTFSKLGRAFDLDLSVDKPFVGGQDGSLDAMFSQHRWFSASVHGEPGSRVKLSVSRSGALGGTVELGDGQRWNIDGGGRSRAVSADGTPESGAAVARQLGRRRRQTGQTGGGRSRARRVCAVFLDASADFYAKWGGVGTATERSTRVAAKMVDAVHGADATFRDPANFGHELGLVVAGLQVHPELQLNGTDGARLQVAYQHWLSDAPATRPLRSGQACLNLLFVHSDLGGWLGAAELGSPDGALDAGACSSRRSGSPVRNTVVVTSLHHGAAVGEALLLHTLVHEFGHSFGARHPCCTGPLCPTGTSCDELPASECNPRGQPFVMHPEMRDDSATVGRTRFSPCSCAAVVDTLRTLGDCLLSPSPCAYGGPCCSGARLRPAGAVCRAHAAAGDDQCFAPPRCNGIDAQCPLPRARPRGTPCQLSTGASTPTLGSCSGGTCNQPHGPACAASGALPCVLPDRPCTRACFDPGWRCSPLTPAAVGIGEPCIAPGGASGRCGADGRCSAVEGLEWTAIASPQAVPQDCAWEPGAWSPCSARCGAGHRTRRFHCRCRGRNGADDSGASCPSPQPAHETAECTAAGCHACSSMLLAAQPDAALPSVLGTYELGGGSLTATNASVNGRRYYVGRGGATGWYLYQVSAFGSDWWAVGQFLGSPYAWALYAVSARMTPAGIGGWSQLGGEEQVQLSVQCSCSAAEGMVLQPDGKRCGLPQGAATGTVPGGVPSSTSSPEPML